MKEKTDTKEKSFEASLKRLEEIVSEMEGGSLPLDARLKRIEEGMRLSTFCSKKLDEAQKKIEMLVKKADGSFETREYSPTADTESGCVESELSPGSTDASSEQESSEEDEPLF